MLIKNYFRRYRKLGVVCAGCYIAVKHLSYRLISFRRNARRHAAVYGNQVALNGYLGVDRQKHVVFALHPLLAAR